MRREVLITKVTRDDIDTGVIMMSFSRIDPENSDKEFSLLLDVSGKAYSGELDGPGSANPIKGVASRQAIKLTICNKINSHELFFTVDDVERYCRGFEYGS